MAQSHDFRLYFTDRLILRAISVNDVNTIYLLNSDPRVWQHLPSARHTSREQTAVQISKETASWKCGLGYWTARMHDNSFAGVGGCCLLEGVAWNLYFRLLPELQGRGLATELARAALYAARSVRPDVPITASLLGHNIASKAVVEKLGLKLVWCGSDVGNPDPNAIRLIYADQNLRPDVLGRLVPK